MPGKIIGKFQADRERLNKLVLERANQPMKRYFSLDGQVYRSGALPAQTKELLGLVASLVLQCDDCVKYHIIQCFNAGVSDAEFEEAMSVGLVVGGSIVIPHLRRAFEAWEDMRGHS